MFRERIAVQVKVKVPPSVSWSLMSDFSLAHKYVPGIVDTEILEGPSKGVDAHRLVYDKSGKAIDETVVEWVENSGFKIRLHQGDKPMVPFNYAQFDYHMSPGENNTTVVKLAMIFELPWGRLGRLLSKLIFKPAITNRVVGVAAGLKVFYESGEESCINAHIERLKPEVMVLPPA